MKPEMLLQEYESSRGFLRELPDTEILTLVGRLATGLLLRHGDGQDGAHLDKSIDAGLGVGWAILEAQAMVLASVDPKPRN
jgi:hypothetical protein